MKQGDTGAPGLNGALPNGLSAVLCREKIVTAALQFRAKRAPDAPARPGLIPMFQPFGGSSGHV
jgi:hypothetical protein